MVWWYYGVIVRWCHSEMMSWYHCEMFMVSSGYSLMVSYLDWKWTEGVSTVASIPSRLTFQNVLDSTWLYFFNIYNFQWHDLNKTRHGTFPKMSKELGHLESGYLNICSIWVTSRRNNLINILAPVKDI